VNAYLLCRIADTIEDAPDFAADEKAALLDLLAACFDDPAAAAESRRAWRPSPATPRTFAWRRIPISCFAAYYGLPDTTRRTSATGFAR